MSNHRRQGGINIKALVILVLVAGVLLGGAVGGYKIRKRMIANRALVAGKAALEQRNWPEACKRLKQYLSRYPDDPEMLARYAEANLAVRPVKAENIGAAIDAYRRFLRLRSGEEKASHQLADLYLQVGDLQEASHISRQRLESEPGDVKAKISLARSLIGLGKADEAKTQWLEPLVKTHPEQVDAYLLLGEIARQDRSAGPEAVLVWLDRAVANNPRSASALLSRAAFRQGRAREPVAATATAPAEGQTRDQAILADLEAADAMRSKDPRLLRLAFDIWLDRGQLDRADAELRAMEALDDKALAESDVEPDSAKLLRFSAAGQLVLRRADAKGCAALADRARQELVGNQRLAFLEMAVDLYLAGDDLAKARETLEELRKGVEPRIAGDPALAEGVAVLDAAVTIKDPDANPFGAITRLREVVLARPRHARAWKLLGDAYLRSGQDLRAMAAYEERLRLVGNDHDSALALARAYLPIEPRRAAPFAALAERSKPDDLQPKIVRLAAQIEASRADSANADRKAIGKELTDLCQSHPESTEVRVLLAKLALAGGKPDDGLAELRKAADECNDKALAAEHLSAYAQELGRTDEALAAARKAVELRKDVAGPRLRLAQAQEAAKQIGDARKTLEQAAVELQGREKLQVEVSLCLFLMAHDAREQGVALCRRLVSEKPQDIQLHLALLGLPETRADAAAAQALVDDLRVIEGDKGLIWPVEQARLWLAGRRDQKREQEIIDQLTHVIDAGSAGPEPVLMLGGLYQSRGDVQEAEEVYRRSLDSRPIFITVVQQLLGLLEKQGRFAEASTLLERLPKDVVALSGHRVNVGVGLGDYKAAIDEVQQRMAADPQDAASRIAMARLVYVQNKDAKAALALLDQAGALAPDLPELLSSRVAILRAAGRSEEALALLDREVTRRNDFFSYQLRAAFHEAAGQSELAEKDYQHLATFKDSPARGYEALARFYGRSDKVDQAIATCEAGLNDAPQDLGLQRVLAAALVIRTDPKVRARGQRMVDDLLKQVPNDGSLLLVKAQVLLENADPASRQAAVAALERVVIIEPRNVRAHLLLIDLARGAGDSILAGKRIIRALGANPGDNDVLLAKAVLEADAKNLVVARDIAEKIIAQDPKYVPALSLLVGLTLRGGDIASAERYNAQVLTVSPGNETARLEQAAILMAKGQPAEAVACVEAYRKTEAGGNSVNCHLSLARLHLQAKRFEDAGRAIDDAQRLAPVGSAVLVARLEWLAAQNRYDDLAGLAAAPPAGTPDIPAYRELAATMLASTGDAKQLKAAVNLCRMVTQSEPQRMSAYLKHGQFAYVAGDLSEAERAYRKALELAPENQQVLNDLAWILGTSVGKPEEAIRLAGKGVSMYPTDPHLRDTRAAILIRLGRLDEARTDLEQCLNLTQEIPATRVSALRQIGQVLAKQGQADQARQRYAEALKIDRDNRVLSEADRAEIRKAIQSLPQ